jgi:hypothetical protein
MAFILHEAMKLKWIAAAWPPRSLPTCSQFLRPEYDQWSTINGVGCLSAKFSMKLDRDDS